VSVHGDRSPVGGICVAAGETDVRTFELATTPLAYCQGEFDCWVKTPGVCRTHDAEAVIVRAIHDAGRVVMLDAVTFGGHSYTMKRAQDRLICLISPFFEKRASLTHHEARYARMASLFKLGWMPHLDADTARTWRELAGANALNMLAPHVGAVVVDDGGRPRWAEDVRTLLASMAVPGADITGREPLREALMAAAGAPARVRQARPRTAALVVGSAKAKGTSLSENLARALSARLEAEGVTLLEQLADVAVEFRHPIRIQSESGLPLRGRFQMCEDVHPRRVEIAEPWCAIFCLSIDEVEGASQELLVDGFHAFLRKRPRVLDCLFTDLPKVFIDSRIVFIGGFAFQHASRAEPFSERRILRVIVIVGLFLRIEVVEVTKEFVESVKGWQMFVPVAKMILAELPGGVAVCRRGRLNVVGRVKRNTRRVLDILQRSL
jgi:hypothetical protein